LFFVSGGKLDGSCVGDGQQGHQLNDDESHVYEMKASPGVSMAGQFT